MLIDYIAIFGVAISITGRNITNLTDIQTILILILSCILLGRFVIGLYSFEWHPTFCIVGLIVWIIYSRYVFAKYGVWLLTDFFIPLRPYQTLLTILVMTFMWHSRLKAVFGKDYIHNIISELKKDD